MSNTHVQSLVQCQSPRHLASNPIWIHPGNQAQPKPNQAFNANVGLLVKLERMIRSKRTQYVPHIMYHLRTWYNCHQLKTIASAGTARELVRHVHCSFLGISRPDAVRKTLFRVLAIATQSQIYTPRCTTRRATSCHGAHHKHNAEQHRLGSIGKTAR